MLETDKSSTDITWSYNPWRKQSGKTIGRLLLIIVISLVAAHLFHVIDLAWIACLILVAITFKYFIPAKYSLNVDAISIGEQKLSWDKIQAWYLGDNYLYLVTKSPRVQLYSIDRPDVTIDLKPLLESHLGEMAASKSALAEIMRGKPKKK